MADVTVTTLWSTGPSNRTPVVWTSSAVGYYFYISSTGTNDLVYRKTTNSGGSWGAEVTIGTDTNIDFGVWYDQWTPGDSGTKIHIVFSGTAADDVIYSSLDTSTDTLLASPVVVFAGASTAADISCYLSIAKMRGGNLYAAFSIDAVAETGFYRSTDGRSHQRQRGWRR